MKKIVNDQLYDTKTAKIICAYNNGCFDGGYVYKTKKGNYFYTWETSGELIPMTIEETKEYLGNYPEIYIEEFGKTEEA